MTGLNTAALWIGYVWLVFAVSASTLAVFFTCFWWLADLVVKKTASMPVFFRWAAEYYAKRRASNEGRE